MTGRNSATGTRSRTTTSASTSASARAGTRRSGPATTARSSATRDRFEARRLDHERREGLRRLRMVLGLAAVASLAVGLIAFVNSGWFDVDEVTVVGNERADTQAVLDASGIAVGDGLLDVDLDRAARSIELVPWVGTATVDRSWLGGITVAVVERGPAAAIAAGERFALVDEHGRQLEVVDRRPPEYLPIRGIEGSGVPGEPAPSEVLPVVALLDALPEDLAGRLASVAVVGGDIHLELADGGLANLGDGADLGRKLQAFETVLARVDLTCLDTIDVRVPDAPVVTRTAELPPLAADDDRVPGTGLAGC